MDNRLQVFERIVRTAFRFTDKGEERRTTLHPFEVRDIHPKIPVVVKELFDDSHYAQATFEAFKYVDKEVQRISEDSESGFKLMMKAFPESNPVIRLTPCNTTTEKDEQKGYQFLFAGAVLAVRNPRGHEYSVKDHPDSCLDHLGLASLLLRRLEKAGCVLK
jgi:uncharacterized protein (TIGR02391 family)